MFPFLTVFLRDPSSKTIKPKQTDLYFVRRKDIHSPGHRSPGSLSPVDRVTIDGFNLVPPNKCSRLERDECLCL